MKTQMMQFRMTDEEKALIEMCAKKAKMMVSEYIRASMLMEMVIDGEVEALQITGRMIGMKVMDALSRRRTERKSPRLVKRGRYFLGSKHAYFQQIRGQPRSHESTRTRKSRLDGAPTADLFALCEHLMGSSP